MRNFTPVVLVFILLSVLNCASQQASPLTEGNKPVFSSSNDAYRYELNRAYHFEIMDIGNDPSAHKLIGLRAFTNWDNSIANKYWFTTTPQLLLNNADETATIANHTINLKPWQAVVFKLNQH
ncbi:hypothetical protein [Pedobacter sp. P26]|uniref:hypothetical protein n=1 Tax=Pedobacter sp. P26 TaxID=3423956 RepID=UPI003D66C0FC